MAVARSDPDLPDELHIALADGVKGVQGVHGHTFCARLQEHKARDRCALCATRCAELDDLNLHVKSPLANDLASRFGDPEHFQRGVLAPPFAGP